MITAGSATTRFTVRGRHTATRDSARTPRPANQCASVPVRQEAHRLHQVQGRLGGVVHLHQELPPFRRAQHVDVPAGVVGLGRIPQQRRSRAAVGGDVVDDQGQHVFVG
ncbi:hypothetical protein [Streptomyces sp. NPDC127119]|uniref:hypothetical protein n=1 Tax=Streptomyces sp. NPDC127119 TaxID=3345370 RepID=UPI00363F0ADD